MDVFGMKKNFYITRKNVQQYAEAISQFLKDYLEASGMDGYVLGLSGGLDSAVAAYLARYANIPLYLLMMPYGDTMEQTGSGRRALEVVEDLGLEGHTTEIDIKPFAAFNTGNTEPERRTDIEEVEIEASRRDATSHKYILNGRVVILKNGILYDILGNPLY